MNILLNLTIGSGMPNEPELEYEKSGRAYKAALEDLWGYLSENAGKSAEGDYFHHIDMGTIGRNVHQLLGQFEDFSNHDGYQDWRTQEAIHLSQIIQKRIWRSQNPAECVGNKVRVPFLYPSCTSTCIQG